MASSTVGITFRETMAGGFNLGSTDTAQGEQAGKAAGCTMSMNATIGIQDLRRFIADPGHLGGLSGSIDFAPLGLSMASTSGVFNLFSPTDNPKLKLMVYEMGFRAQGKDYYLAGQKDVQEHPVYELWKDTTTLYSLLHEGEDKSGKVVGAGILSLGLEALVKMCLAMRATDAASPLEAAQALTDFGHFFLGELWDTYIIKKAV